MTEQVEQATAEDIRLQFWEAVAQADRIQVHKLNALGEYDTHNFGADAIAALTVTPQEAAKVLLGYAAGIKPAVEAYDDQTFSSLQDFGAFTFALECIAQEDSHE